MSQRCEITGKGKQYGKNVSFFYATYPKGMETKPADKNNCR